MQADIFNAKIVKLSNEQGPGMGAAMLAAYGCGWFETLRECTEEFCKKKKLMNRLKKMLDGIKHYSDYIKEYTT